MEQRSIFITGASTGIGLASARHLKQAGFQVFAGVLPTEDTSALDEDEIKVISIDITKANMIDTVRDKIAQAVGSDGLYGLFNNAGTAYAGPMEFIPMEAIRKQLEVNLFGHIAVTQAFLPLIRQAQGRILNTASILGRVATPMAGPYCMSKFAMEAFTDTLRRELKSHNIYVSALEPGAIATKIWEKTIKNGDEIWDELPNSGQELYQNAKSRTDKAIHVAVKGAISPDEVAKSVVHAFTASRPKTRYLVGSDAKSIAFLAWLLPDRLLDYVLERR